MLTSVKKKEEGRKLRCAVVFAVMTKKKKCMHSFKIINNVCMCNVFTIIINNINN